MSTEQLAPSAKEFVKLAQGLGLAHNNGAGGQWLLCATPAQLEALAVAVVASKPAPSDGDRPRLSPYDAVARAMDLASLLAGSVGMNNKEKADAYSSRLRSHLVEYIYPASQAPAPQDQSVSQELTDAQLDSLMPGAAYCVDAGSGGSIPGYSTAQVRTSMRAALAAQPAAPVVPPGFWLAPDEPSEAMLMAVVKGREGPAVYKVLSSAGLKVCEQEAADDYEALRAAHLATAKAPGV